MRDVIAEVEEPKCGCSSTSITARSSRATLRGPLEEFAPIAGHYQIASPPDRGEPDDGEMSYAYLFKAIDRTGFDGWVGCETTSPGKGQWRVVNGPPLAACATRAQPEGAIGRSPLRCSCALTRRLAWIEVIGGNALR